jgi:hypothetical protein
VASPGGSVLCSTSPGSSAAGRNAETYRTERELSTAVDSFASWREVAGGGLQ